MSGIQPVNRIESPIGRRTEWVLENQTEVFLVVVMTAAVKQEHSVMTEEVELSTWMRGGRKASRKMQ